MRNIESSPWLTQPELVEIKSVPSPINKDLRVNEFTLNVQVKKRAPPEEPKAARPRRPPAPAPAAPPPRLPRPKVRRRDMNLDDIRRLNIREVGNWPLLPRIVMLLLDLHRDADRAARCSTGRTATRSSTRRGRRKARLKEQYATKKAKAINYDIYVQQLKEIEQSFGALLKQLPNKAEMDALLTDINQAGLGRGLQFELFKPAAQERLADFYAELPISVRITGNYHDMGAFASDVAQLPRIVTLNDVAIQNDKGVLTMDAVAKTFRYLDEEELAKQRKAAKDAKDKEKAKK